MNIKTGSLVFILVFICSFLSEAHNTNCFEFQSKLKTHSVQEGETIDQIANKYNISRNKLIRYNPDLRKGIRTGQQLLIPNQGMEEKTSNEFIVVEKKATLFSITRKHNISAKELKSLNPFLNDRGLQPGDTLRLTPKSSISNEKSAVIENENAPEIYTIKTGDSKFNISQRYNIPEKQLELLNPDTNWNALPIGAIIRLKPLNETPDFQDEVIDSEPKYIEYQVQPKETMYSLTKQFSVSAEKLYQLNPELEKGLKAGILLKIPKVTAINDPINFLPYHKLNLLDSVQNRELKKIALILPLQVNFNDTLALSGKLKSNALMRIAVDFYLGVKIAVDSVEQLGIPVQLDVYDLPMSNNELVQLVSSEKFTKYHSIIGPFRSEKVQLVAKTLKSDRIPIISPLTKSDVRLYRNLFQSRPDENVLEDLMLSYLNELNEQHRVTLLDDNFNKSEIALLTQKINAINRISLNASGVISAEEINQVLSPTSVNTFVLSINNIPILNSVLRHLTEKLKTHQIQIVVLNPGKAYEDESIKPETLGKLHYTYPSISNEIEESNAFVKSFQKTYQLIPNAYTVRGFDITYDILLRLSQGINIYESLEKDYTTEYAASRFRYQKKFLEGYTNTAAFILQYQPDLSVKVLNP